MAIPGTGVHLKDPETSMNLFCRFHLNNFIINTTILQVGFQSGLQHLNWH